MERMDKVEGKNLNFVEFGSNKRPLVPLNESDITRLLDHYDGYLSDFYKKHDFEEYERFPWDNQYAPEGWEYDKYGTPDVVLRRLSLK